MAIKRFTDSKKWDKRWFRTLPPEVKLIWMYILDKCDHAGVWEVDFELADFYLGLDKDLIIEDVKTHLEKQYHSFDGGKRWFIPSFIEFQYGSTLNPNNRCHGSVIKVLSKYNLLDLVESIKPLDVEKEGPSKGLSNKTEGVMEQEQDMVLVLNKEKEEGIVKGRLKPLPSGYGIARQPISPSLWEMEKPELLKVFDRWSMNKGSKRGFLDKCRELLDFSEPGVGKRLENARNGYCDYLNTTYGDGWEKKVSKLFFWLDEWENYYDPKRKMEDYECNTAR